MRYKDSVEDDAHHMLSARLREIYDLFGQVPDVLEDVWGEVALGAKDQAKALIDAVPKQHPFESRYHGVETIDWESCTRVLDRTTKADCLREGWG